MKEKSFVLHTFFLIIKLGTQKNSTQQMLIKYFPLKTLTVQEGDPFGIGCDAPDGWPQPNILWMLEGQNSLKSVNSSRLTVDPAGKLWFSNVTYDDMSDNFLYACSAASYFRNEYKLGNRVHLHVIPSAPRYLFRFLI